MLHTVSRFLKLGLAFCIAATLVGCASGGRHSYNDPFAYCAAVRTIDTLDSRYNGARLPDSIIQAMVRQGIVSTDAPLQFQENAVWRCMDGKVWVCHFGANLPCLEKAHTAQLPTPGMENYCKNNPSAHNIPAVVTGRATVYEWKCESGKPKIVRQLFTSDRQGFLSEFWHEVTPE